MTETTTYCKRLIEVDLPIKRISIHSAREKSIRHGHISTLHMWWARRPLASCRAVICASLWPDPVDELCPEEFRLIARDEMISWANEHSLWRVDPESFQFFSRVTNGKIDLTDDFQLRQALLHFIADFANWDNSTKIEYIQTSHHLTQSAHESLGGIPGTRPMVLDPFAGGGSIPLETLRIGGDAFASDLNPIAVLLNKVVLEYVPKYGKSLAEEVLKWGNWIKNEAEKELAEFYPKDDDGGTPITYIWARTVKCEGPSCGVEIPLMRSLWLTKKKNASVALKFVNNNKTIGFEILQNPKSKEVTEGTVKRGSATCPVCNYTTPVNSVRTQLKKRRGGTNDAQLICVYVSPISSGGRQFRLPIEKDLEAYSRAKSRLLELVDTNVDELNLIPNEFLDIRGIRHTWAMVYGMEQWGDYFTQRQLLALLTFTKLVKNLPLKPKGEFEIAIQTCLGLGVGRCVDYWSSLALWAGEFVAHTFGRQAIPFVSDFAEAVPLANASGNWEGAIGWITRFIQREGEAIESPGQSLQCSASEHILPDDSCQAFITDPPYYDAVAYAYLSDYFYTWFKRILGKTHPNLFNEVAVPKDDEIIVDREHTLSNSLKDIKFYEERLTQAFAHGRRIVSPSGIGVVVFASKTTSSWEAILQAIISSGWIITGSWPIDTERQGRVSATNQARLQSSIHIVCRTREDSNGALKENYVGDWRDVLRELPVRIHDWMPRLINDGVVGADAIFACLGPALEIFSRYSRVEEADGTVVPLRDYLEKVWAAVGREAFSNIFSGADANGFEEDARLTAIWFWALKGANDVNDKIEAGDDNEQNEEDPDEGTPSKANSKNTGYTMEYDAIRKLAQGLGVNLDNLNRPNGIITIKGGTATLNSITSRSQYLLGIQQNLFEEIIDSNSNGNNHRGSKNKTVKMKAVESRQMTLMDIDTGFKLDTPDQPALFETELLDERTLLQRLLDNGTTVLDRLHQAMLLFSEGQTALINPFLEAAGMHKSEFWQLAQSLSALYPINSSEKRLVDGLLAFTKNKRFIRTEAVFEDDLSFTADPFTVRKV